MIPQVLSGVAIGVLPYAVCFAAWKCVCYMHRWIIKKYNGENTRDRNILVIFFNNIEDRINLLPTPFRSLKLHWQNSCDIVYKEVKSIDEMDHFLEKMKSQNNRIQGLWIKAHGNHFVMDLGEEVNSISYSVDGKMYPKNSDQLKSL